MNTIKRVPFQPLPDWSEPAYRQILRDRDVRQLYLLLQGLGFPQRQIAYLTGQSQPEISEILSRKRP
jgi:predicted XRE-type DNA-binding protein